MPGGLCDGHCWPRAVFRSAQEWFVGSAFQTSWVVCKEAMCWQGLYLAHRHRAAQHRAWLARLHSSSLHARAPCNCLSLTCVMAALAPERGSRPDGSAATCRFKYRLPSAQCSDKHAFLWPNHQFHLDMSSMSCFFCSLTRLG